MGWDGTEPRAAVALPSVQIVLSSPAVRLEFRFHGMAWDGTRRDSSQGLAFLLCPEAPFHPFHPFSHLRLILLHAAAEPAEWSPRAAQAQTGTGTGTGTMDGMAWDGILDGMASWMGIPWEHRPPNDGIHRAFHVRPSSGRREASKGNRSGYASRRFRTRAARGWPVPSTGIVRTSTPYIHTSYAAGVMRGGTGACSANAGHGIHDMAWKCPYIGSLPAWLCQRMDPSSPTARMQG